MTKAKPRKPKPSALVAALVANGKRGPTRWKFSEKALADIAEARAVNESGRAWISASRLARALRDAYAIPVTVKTIATRLADMHGGRW